MVIPFLFVIFQYAGGDRLLPPAVEALFEVEAFNGLGAFLGKPLDLPLFGLGGAQGQRQCQGPCRTRAFLRLNIFPF